MRRPLSPFGPPPGGESTTTLLKSSRGSVISSSLLPHFLRGHQTPPLSMVPAPSVVERAFCPCFPRSDPARCAACCLAARPLPLGCPHYCLSAWPCGCVVPPRSSPPLRCRPPPVRSALERSARRRRPCAPARAVVPLRLCPPVRRAAGPHCVVRRHLPVASLPLPLSGCHLGSPARARPPRPSPPALASGALPSAPTSFCRVDLALPPVWVGVLDGRVVCT